MNEGAKGNRRSASLVHADNVPAFDFVCSCLGERERESRRGARERERERGGQLVCVNRVKTLTCASGFDESRGRERGMVC